MDIPASIFTVLCLFCHKFSPSMIKYGITLILILIASLIRIQEENLKQLLSENRNQEQQIVDMKARLESLIAVFNEKHYEQNTVNILHRNELEKLWKENKDQKVEFDSFRSYDVERESDQKTTNRRFHNKLLENESVATKLNFQTTDLQKKLDDLINETTNVYKAISIANKAIGDVRRYITDLDDRIEDKFEAILESKRKQNRDMRDLRKELSDIENTFEEQIRNLDTKVEHLRELSEKQNNSWKNKSSEMKDEEQNRKGYRRRSEYQYKEEDQEKGWDNKNYDLKRQTHSLDIDNFVKEGFKMVASYVVRTVVNIVGSVVSSIGSFIGGFLSW